jgi:hypothetical protein
MRSDINMGVALSDVYMPAFDVNMPEEFVGERKMKLLMYII